MALWNEVLSGRFNEGLKRFFTIAGEAPSPQMAGEISPSLDLFHVPAEFNYLQGIRMAGAWAASGATAGKNAYVQLTNPTGSNALAVIERIASVCPTAALAILYSVDPVARAGTLATAQAGYRDTRYSTAATLAIPVCTYKYGNDVGANPVQTLFETVPATSVEHIGPSPIVLLPGWNFTVWAASANTSFTCAMLWTERALGPYEVP